MMLPADITILARAVNAANSSLVITDNELFDHPIIFCNPAFEKMTGYTHDEIIGRNCRFLQGTDTSQQSLREVRRAIESGEECSVFFRNYRKDGTIFFNELFLSPVKSDDGLTTHFIGIQKDITDRVTGRNPGNDLINLGSHELRTPLTTIKGTLQLLQKRGLSVDPAFLQKSVSAALLAVGRLEKLGKNLFE